MPPCADEAVPRPRLARHLRVRRRPRRPIGGPHRDQDPRREPHRVRPRRHRLHRRDDHRQPGRAVSGTIDSTGNARIEIAKSGAMTTATPTTRAALASPSCATPPVSVSRPGDAAPLEVPRLPGARPARAARGCLRPLPARVARDAVARRLPQDQQLDDVDVAGGSMARGTVLGRIFENTFRVRLRRSSGAVVAAKTVTTATAPARGRRCCATPSRPGRPGWWRRSPSPPRTAPCQCFYQRR